MAQTNEKPSIRAVVNGTAQRPVTPVSATAPADAPDAMKKRADVFGWLKSNQTPIAIGVISAVVGGWILLKIAKR